MGQIDTQRVADIARRFLESTGTTAIVDWKPTDFDLLQVALHNTIMREYPELDADLWFRMGRAVQRTPDSSLQVEVQMLRVVGQIEVEV
jgi:hypothetical protein